MSEARSTTGLTRDVGWQLGVRRTAAVDTERAWAYVTGPGLATWLGGVDRLPTAVGDPWSDGDGAGGELRGHARGRRVRLTMRRPGVDHETTVQLTLLEATSGTTLALHEERLRSADERAARLAHWTDVVERLVAALEAGQDSGQGSR